MNIIVIGGAGFIGSNFVFHMLKKYPDYRIICLDKLTYAGNLSTLAPVMDNPNFRFVKADICDREAVDKLFDAILSLKDKEECYRFFEDVCTINELLSLSQRFEVAKMLTDKRTYLDISEKTGASTATISRVNRSLNYGNDGYEMVFSRMKEKETAGKTEE